VRPSRTLPLTAALVVLVATTVAVAAPPSQNTVQRQTTGPIASPTASLGATVGVAPPSLNVARLAGQDAADLGQLAGRVVVLEFWATWCVACQTLNSFLNTLHAEWHDEGLTVLGVSSESEDQIRTHLSRSRMDYTIARDLGPTSARYRVRSFPTIVLIGRDGKVRHLMVGANGQRVVDLMTRIRRELDEPAP